jgi:hypothetical protein
LRIVSYLWNTVSISIFPLGTLAVLTTADGTNSLGMVIGTWSLNSANDFCDHVGRVPTQTHGELGYIILLNNEEKLVRVFYGDPDIGKLKRETV